MNLNEIFTQLLNYVTGTTGGNLGVAIIIVTLLIRSALLPLVLPSIKSQKKIRELQPEIAKLKKKYKDDKETFARKQMDLYKQHKVNPLGGCLPQIVQLVLFIAFYRVLTSSLNGGDFLNGATQFLWLDLTLPDQTYLLPVVTALSQFVLGVMLLPATDVEAEEKLASKTTTSKDDTEALDADAMAKTMQTQMILVMPIMTGFIALKFPSGLALYWVTSTLYSLVQQYLVSGIGGWKKYLVRFGIIS